MKPRVISLFAGCGGFDLGLEMAGAKSIFACDIFNDALQTYKHNFKDVKVVKGDVRKIETFPEAEIIIGGYPCQGFSVAGNRIVDDPRNFLYKEFVRAVSQVQPHFFVAENVKGMLTMGEGKVIEAMVQEFAEQGYTVSYRLYNAKEAGVPQDRLRVFIVGVRNDLDFEYIFPEGKYGEEKGKLPYATLRDSIGHLPLDPKGEYNESGFSPRYMAANRKRGWNQVSYTIQASGRHAPIHPSGEPMIKLGKESWAFQGDWNRKLSFRECGLIQSFPADYEFLGTLDNRYKMIGNAVPPLLAKLVATPIMEYFNEKK